MATLKTYTFIGNTEESPILSVLGYSLPIQSAHANEKTDYMETWFEPYPYWPVEKTMQYPFLVLFYFSYCGDYICSLSFLFHRDFFHKGPRSNKNCQSPHR